MSGDTERLNQLAVQFAIQRILAKAPGVEFRAGTVDTLNLYGPGIHGVIIDGDTEGGVIAAHQVGLAFPQAGGRVAVAFTKPHQAWILGNLQLTGSAARAWTSVNTAIGALNVPQLVAFDSLSYDNGDNFDIPAGLYLIPSRGLYDIRWSILSVGFTGTVRASSSVRSAVTSTILSTGNDITSTDARITLAGADTLYLDDGEMIGVYVNQSTGPLIAIDGIAGREDINFFSVRQVG